MSGGPKKHCDRALCHSCGLGVPQLVPPGARLPVLLDTKNNCTKRTPFRLPRPTRLLGSARLGLLGYSAQVLGFPRRQVPHATAATAAVLPPPLDHVPAPPHEPLTARRLARQTANHPPLRTDEGHGHHPCLPPPSTLRRASRVPHTQPPNHGRHACGPTHVGQKQCLQDPGTYKCANAHTRVSGLMIEMPPLVCNALRST
jgi:hypothetical protein